MQSPVLKGEKLISTNFTQVGIEPLTADLADEHLYPLGYCVTLRKTWNCMAIIVCYSPVTFITLRLGKFSELDPFASKRVGWDTLHGLQCFP